MEENHIKVLKRGILFRLDDLPHLEDAKEQYYGVFVINRDGAEFPIMLTDRELEVGIRRADDHLLEIVRRACIDSD